MQTTEEIEEALINAVDLVKKETGFPDSIWHPSFGWVMFEGKPTETTEEFLKYMNSKTRSEK
jgi:hypothetical protein